MQGDRHYDYDAYGNLARERRGTGQKLVTEYRYDCQHRLIGVSLPGGSAASYKYDAFGRRIAKTVDGHTTEFLWQGERLRPRQWLGLIGAIAESAENRYRSYIYEPGTFRPLAMLDGEGPLKPTPFYYQLDHLGTPQELTDYSGEIMWSAKYRAYGNLATLDVAEIDNPLRFQGQYFDAETGLHYNRHRYYNPGTGRFLTPDPIKLAGGLNNYQYVPNPTGWVDPLGLNTCPGGDGCKPSNPIEDPATKVSVEELTRAPDVAQSKPDFYVGPSGADSTLPSTGYRYIRYKNDDGSINKWGQDAIETKTQGVTYFGFEKHETGKGARDAFQVKGPEHGPDENGPGSWSDARIRAEFDTLQLYINGKPKARVPFWKGDTDKTKMEPLAEAYEQYGDGGAAQLHLDGQKVNFNQLDILPEE